MPPARRSPTPQSPRPSEAPLPALRGHLFDAAFYLDEYPDAAGSGLDPFEHYLVAGISEGRRTRRGVARRAEREPAWTAPWLQDPGQGEDARDPLQRAVSSTARFRCHVGAGALARDRFSIQIRSARAAGVLLAPVAVLLVASAIADARSRGLRAVHYLSREGAVLRQVHQAVQPILSDDPVAARHLAVSRLSTFGPSVAALGGEDLARLWRMYPDQSTDALFGSLGLDPRQFDAAARRHGIEPHVPVTDIAAAPAVRSLLDDEAVGPSVTAQLDVRRSRLRAYLEQETERTDGTLLVVDVGWRGSIQDNLARVVPEWHWVGRYLGLLGYLNPQPPNVEKRSTGPDANRDEDTSWMGPSHVLELALSTQSPSVVGYEPTPDGRVVPVTVPTDAGGERGRRLAAELQASMMLSVRALAHAVRDDGLDVDRYRPTLDRLLWNLLHDPPPGLADVVFESAHDETFGTANVLPFAVPEPGRHAVLWSCTTEALQRLAEEGRTTRWPAGWRRWQPVRTLRAVLGDGMP